jgi:hypothetical protein
MLNLFMIRVSIVSFLIFSTISLFSQTTEQHRDLGDFTSIEMSGSIDVVYVPSEKYDIVIHSEFPDDVLTELRDKKLIIHTKNGKSLAWNEIRSIGKKYKVYVYVPTLNEIEASGSGNILLNGILKSDNLSILTAGSGNVTGQLNVESLKLKSAGSGNFRLSGNVVEASISSSGSGNIQSFDLYIENCAISKSGSGNTQITVSKSLKASISGSGNMNYRGTPNTVSCTSAGSGKIKKV